MQARSARQQALAENQQRPPTALKVPAGEWLEVQPHTLQLGVAVNGNLKAVDTALIKATIPGQLRGLELREGDAVRAGQIVAQVDATETEARHRQALLQAQAAQAQVKIQQRQLDNNQALVEKGFISATALSTSEANLQAAQANYAAARAAQDGAKKNLDDTVIRSPISGQVARRWVQNGERVQVEAPVLEVVNLSALELEVALAANDSLQVQVGHPARLELAGSTGMPPSVVKAEVVRINPSADAANRTVATYLRLDQPSAGTVLRPGMYVQGFILTGAQQALALPLDAVRTDQPQPYVQAVVDGKVQHLPVRVGAKSVPGLDAQAGSVPWVAVEEVAAGTQVLSARVGALPAGTAVHLLPANPATPAP